MENLIECGILIDIVMEFNMSNPGIRRFLYISLFVLLVLLFPALNLMSEEKTNFNEFYKFPLSIGVDYVGLSPFNDYGFDVTLTEVSGNVRYPLPSIPQLQPMIQFGVMQFSDLNRDEPEKWDHTHYFGALGALWSNRFSKTFELSGELAFGLSQAVFPNIDPEGISRGSLNILGSAGLRASLNPAYNLSIDIHPALRYMKYIGAAETFGLFIWFSF